MGKPFAVFDIDGTLFRWQLFHELVFELVDLDVIPKHVGADLAKAKARWRNREHTQSFKEYEMVVVDTIIKYLPDTPVESFHKAAERILKRSSNHLYAYTRDLIADLRKQGYLIFAISGSFEEIVAPFARTHGFDDWRATTCEHENGRFTGVAHWMTHDGIHRKPKSLQEMVDQHGATFKGSIAVGDTSSDIGMLEMVEQPIAFNPNDDLLKHAQEHGWQVVVERKNVVYKLNPDPSGNYILSL